MKDYKKINMIIPYFGKFPNYFPLFLRSCEMNPTINWTIISDNQDYYKYPKNVNFIFMTFEELKDRVYSLFNFSIYLEHPYKLCDYKPAYGYIFYDLIKDFDYWGYCDIDVVYGNVRKFLTEDVLKFKKIFVLGHFSLVENDKSCNEMFMATSLYKTVFSNKGSYNFDEEFMNKPNINKIFESNGIPVYKESFAADIYTKSSDFILDYGDSICENRKNAFFIWNDGKLIRYIEENNRILEKEFMYIHLQKRKMTINIDMDVCTTFKIIPNSFDNLEIKYSDIYERFNEIVKKHFNLQYYKIRYKNFLVKAKKFL